MFSKRAFTLPYPHQQQAKMSGEDYEQRITMSSDSYPRSSGRDGLDIPVRNGIFESLNGTVNKGFQFDLIDQNTSNTKTMYTRQSQKQKFAIGTTGSNSSRDRTAAHVFDRAQVTDRTKYRSSLRSEEKRKTSERDIDSPTRQNYHYQERGLTIPNNSHRTADKLNNTTAKPYNENIELDYVTTKTADSAMQCNQSNPSNVQCKRGENTSRIGSQAYNAQKIDSVATLPRQYSDQISTLNHDLISLHSMVSRKSIRKKQTVWTNKLFYTLVGLLLWTFIVRCIEDIDGTIGRNICLKNQEIRYWASYVCLVVITTAICVYLEKSTIIDSIMLSLFNLVILISIHHVPLHCIKQDKLSIRQMGRIRGSLLLLTTVIIFLTWLSKRYTRNKKK